MPILRAITAVALFILASWVARPGVYSLFLIVEFLLINKQLGFVCLFYVNTCFPLGRPRYPCGLNADSCFHMIEKMI